MEINRSKKEREEKWVGEEKRKENSRMKGSKKREGRGGEISVARRKRGLDLRWEGASEGNSRSRGWRAENKDSKGRGGSVVLGRNAAGFRKMTMVWREQ